MILVNHGLDASRTRGLAVRSGMRIALLIISAENCLNRAILQLSDARIHIDNYTLFGIIVMRREGLKDIVRSR